MFLRLLVILFWGVSQALAKDVVVSISSVPNSLNPLFSTDANAQNILRLTHRSLGDFDREMNFSCDLCESYKEIRDNNYRIWFRLKKDATFTNNHPIKISDVINSWNYYISEDNKSVFRHAFNNIKEIKVLNETDFEIIYDRYHEDALSNLVLLKIIKIQNDNIFGAGDFVLLNSNDFEIVLSHKSLNNKIIFKVVRDETTLALKMLNKEIDIAFNSISARKMKWLEDKNKLINIAQYPSGNLQYLAINHKKVPFNDVRFRKALREALKVDELIDYRLKNYVQKSSGLFSSVFVNYYEKFNYEKVDFDKTMSEMGYTKNRDGYYGNQFGEFVIDWKVSNNRNAIEVAEIFKDQLRKVGIKVKLSIQEWGTYMNAFRSGNYDVLMAQWVGFTGPEMLNFAFHSESIPPKGGNRVFYQSDTVDSILDMAKDELDVLKKRAMYKEVARKTSEDIAYIFLWHPNSVIITNNCYKGIIPYPNGNFKSIVEVERRCE